MLLASLLDARGLVVGQHIGRVNGSSLMQVESGWVLIGREQVNASLVRNYNLISAAIDYYSNYVYDLLPHAVQAAAARRGLFSFVQRSRNEYRKNGEARWFGLSAFEGGVED